MTPDDTSVMSAAAGDSLDVRILGDCAILSRAGPLGLKGGKALGMFVALCLAPHARLTRAHLVELLWLDAKDGNAAFRQALKALRDGLKRAAPGVLLEPPGALQLNRDAVTLDSDALLQRLAAGEVPDDLMTHAPAETLLQGLDGLSTPFDQYLREQRERFRARLVDALRRVLDMSPEMSVRRGDAARAILVTDPTDEVAVRALMHWLWIRGEPTAATKVYNEFCRTLDELEADAEPSRKTLELLRDIKLELDDVAPAAPAGPAEARPFAEVAGRDGVAPDAPAA
ncbi:MAG: hypothetical protein AAFR52_04610, partial [Pseudomonadota bacterium]